MQGILHVLFPGCSLVKVLKIFWFQTYWIWGCVSSLEMLWGPDSELPEKLRNLEPRLIELVGNEIMDKNSNVQWDDMGNQKQ